MKYDKIIEKIKETLPKKTLESLIKENTDNKNAFNVFNILNLGENSHSELLKWLFNVNDKVENSIQYAFMKEFITYLVDMEYIKIDDVKKFIDLLSDDIVVPEKNTCKFKGTSNKFIDISFSSKKANFLCVIENKLDAKVNTDNDGVTQLEHYVNYINDDPDQTYKDYEKLFLFLSPMTDKLENKRCKTVCRGRYSQVKCMGNDFTNRKFRCLLKELGYKTIEYSDIVLFIYKALQKININSKKDYFEYFFEKFSELIIEANKSYKIEDGNKTGNFNIQLKDVMNNVQNNKNSGEMFKYILNQYIEYWEFFAEYIGGGYSRIVDVEYKDEKYSVFKTDLEKILEEKISK